MLKTSPSQTHAMTYTSSHPEVFYKKVFLKNSQNSQESSCAGVSFFCKFHKNEALVHVIFCELCEFSRTLFLQNTYGSCFWTYIHVNQYYTSANGLVGKFYGWLRKLFLFGWFKTWILKIYVLQRNKTKKISK